MPVDDDPLIAQVVRAVGDQVHPYCFLERYDALSRGRQHDTNPPSHSPAFYRKLAEILGDPCVNAVAYRAEGDHAVLRLMATEQARRRFGLWVLAPECLGGPESEPDAWAAEIAFYGADIGLSDPFIEGGGLADERLTDNMAIPKFEAKRFIFASQDHGPIRNYAPEIAEHCVLCTRTAPDTKLASSAETLVMLEVVLGLSLMVNRLPAGAADAWRRKRVAHAPESDIGAPECACGPLWRRLSPHK